MLIIKQSDQDGKSRATVVAVLFRASQCSTRRHLEGFHLREPPPLTSVPFQLIQAPVPHGPSSLWGWKGCILCICPSLFSLLQFLPPSPFRPSSTLPSELMTECVQGRPQLVNSSHLPACKPRAVTKGAAEAAEIACQCSDCGAWQSLASSTQAVAANP